MLWELQFKLQFIGLPYMYQKKKKSFDFVFHFWHFTVFSVTSSTLFDVIYSITQKYQD